MKDKMSLHTKHTDILHLTFIVLCLSGCALIDILRFRMYLFYEIHIILKV